MVKSFRFLAGTGIMLFIIFFTPGCALLPPQPLQVPVYNAAVFITANVPGSEIILDGVKQPYVTPDTVFTTEGSHRIDIVNEGYLTASYNVTAIADSVITLDAVLTASVQRVVLLEDFANTSCVPCVTSNLIIKSIRSYTYGANKLLAVKIPTNFPGSNDPLYLAAKTYCDSRMSYYNIIFAPTTIIDGIIKPVSSDSIKVKAAIEQRLAVPPKYKISITDSVYGGNIHYKVDLKCLDSTAISNSELILRVKVIEEEITFATPPGSNGETVFYDVLREKLPDPNGTILPKETIYPGSNLQFNFTTSVKSAWHINQIRAIAFVQNRSTREVYQSATTD